MKPRLQENKLVCEPLKRHCAVKQIRPKSNGTQVKNAKKEVELLEEFCECMAYLENATKSQLGEYEEVLEDEI